MLLDTFQNPYERNSKHLHPPPPPTMKEELILSVTGTVIGITLTDPVEITLTDPVDVQNDPVLKS